MASSYVSRLGDAPEEGIKAPVVATATSNITLAGAQTIAGVAVVAGDRVCVTGQTTASENGLYVCRSGAWTRAVDFNAANDVVNGVLVLDSGTSELRRAQFTGDWTPGTTAVTFTLLSNTGEPVQPVANIAALALVDTALLVAGSVIYVVSYSTAGDGGHARYYWSSSDLSTEVAADTRKGLFVPPSSDVTGASGAWVKLLEDNTITPEMFGATGGSDDSAALLGMGAQAKLYSLKMSLKPRRTYNSSVARLLEIFSGFELRWNGATINISAAATLNDTTGTDTVYDNGCIWSDETSSAITGVKIIGPGYYSTSTAKALPIQIGTVNTATSTYATPLFSDVEIAHIHRLESTGYTTDNGFYAAGVNGFRLHHCSTSGGYRGCRFHNLANSVIEYNLFTRPGNDASYTEWANSNGVHMFGGKNVTIRGNKVFASGGTSVLVRSYPNFVVNGLYIYDNDIDMAGLGGIQVQTLASGATAVGLTDINVHHNKVTGWMCAPAATAHNACSIQGTNAAHTVEGGRIEDNDVDYIGSLEAFTDSTAVCGTTYNTVKQPAGGGAGSGNAALFLSNLNTTGALSAVNGSISRNKVRRYQGTGVRASYWANVKIDDNQVDLCGWGRDASDLIKSGEDAWGVALYRCFKGSSKGNLVTRHGVGLDNTSLADPTKNCGMRIDDCCSIDLGTNRSGGNTYYGLYALATGGAGASYTYLGQSEVLSLRMVDYVDADAYLITVGQAWAFHSVRFNSHPVEMSGTGAAIAAALTSTTTVNWNPSIGLLHITATTGATSVVGRLPAQSINAQFALVNAGSHTLSLYDGVPTLLASVTAGNAARVRCDGVNWHVEAPTITVV